jgi:Transposase DDE domain
MKKNTVVLNQLSSGRSDLVGFSRFLNNEKITSEGLIQSAVSRCSELVAGRSVLVINDTTDFNFRDHFKYLSDHDEDLGPMSNDGDLGFYLHPGLVIDAEKEIGLGFSYIKIWSREKGNVRGRGNKNYVQLPLEEKETYRWIECGLESKKNLRTATHLTIIADRESDIYQEFALLPDNKTDLIIRSCQNRRLHDSDVKLYETLSQADCCGAYELKVRANQNGKRQGRDTRIEVRFKKVKIAKPTTVKDNLLPDYIELFAIEAQEKSDHLPVDEKPICWRILTTFHISDLNGALQVIKSYGMRWQIELLFGTMKSKGLNMESSQLESGGSLKNLCLLALQVSLKINQLTQGREMQIPDSAKIVFTPEQIIVLTSLIKQFEGKTEKQKNAFPPGTLAWAAWVIARMGGWKGYDSEAKPGNKTISIGLTRFEDAFIGWNLAQKICA